MTTSRNSPCQCGSGKKYKHCCGALSDVMPTRGPSLLQITTLMNRGLAAHRAGNLKLAAENYDQVLALDPNQRDVLHMRGVVFMSEGQPRVAKGYFDRARNAGLNTADFLHNCELLTKAIKEGSSLQSLRDALLMASEWKHDEASDEFISPKEIGLLAYFLPQFHRTPENDEWWGEGFTEWTNVRRGKPNFDGHYQPRLPGELGYYNLLDPQVREQQAALARQYGVTGFCYYHYWFGGRRMLEQPLELLLKSPKPDFPFCIFWANENWSKRWDGGNHELLLEQVHSPEDDVAFIEHLLPYFNDHRYIRIDGRPLLMIYRIEQFEHPRQTIKRWRDICRANGLPAPYIVKADTRDSGPPEVFGADASVEFPPHRLHPGILMPRRPDDIHPDYRGTLLDYATTAAYMSSRHEAGHTHYRTVIPDWDNTARKQMDGTTFIGSTPDLFRAWLRETLVRTRELLPPGHRFVFVNAWNEWAEGACLEPDGRHGRAMLEAAWAARFLPRKSFKRLAEIARDEAHT